MAKKLNNLETTLRELASYHGLLARWGDLTGNAAPHDADRVVWQRERFRDYLEELSEMKRKA